MNSRQKGLNLVRMVRKMLEGMHYIVEGPGYSVAFYGGSMKPIHRDYFGIADLISYADNQFILHQVTDLSNKAKHVKDIQSLGIPCWLWCKIDGKTGFRVFFVSKDYAIEGSAMFRGGYNGR